MAAIVQDEQDATDLAIRKRVEDFGVSLVSQDTPIGKRMRAIFYLRGSPSEGGHRLAAEKFLCKALIAKDDSILLRHEIAYVLGQMQSTESLDTLKAILSDTSDDPIVRHECAEALGAIAAPGTLEYLERFVDDERSEVSETCKIAVDRLKWAGDGDAAAAAAPEGLEFDSIDPAPALEAETKTEELEKILLDGDLPLFTRYRAMFSLRNANTEESVLALVKGLKDSSALFRHEVAYVLGQMAHVASVPALTVTVKDVEEHGMVRHEAAEALGAVGTEECLETLKEYAADEVAVVRESCVVALDAAEYWQSFAAKPDEGAASNENVLAQEVEKSLSVEGV